MRCLLALTLFMAWVVTNDKHTTFAPDNFTLITHLLDRRTYLHIKLPFGSFTNNIFLAQPQAIVVVENQIVQNFLAQ